MADDAGIELSYWALPNETPVQKKAHASLCRFAHFWWVFNLTREAYAWLAENGHHPKDAAAIEDCIIIMLLVLTTGIGIVVAACSSGSCLQSAGGRKMPVMVWSIGI